MAMVFSFCFIVRRMSSIFPDVSREFLLAEGTKPEGLTS